MLLLPLQGVSVKIGIEPQGVTLGYEDIAPFGALVAERVHVV